ncbi:MAG: hypothetical protein HMLIMOIP_002074 [Candidatus Nitrosomirales archaeon]|jgi:hypothetical protein
MEIEEISFSAYNALKFCPECGKELETHPISGWKTCFLHGDFEMFKYDIYWRFTKNLIKR